MLPRPQRRQTALALLVPVVLVLHLWTGDWVAGQAVVPGDGAAAGSMKRMKADFIVDLAPVAPPPEAPRPLAAATVRPRAAAPAASAAASAAMPAREPAPEPLPPEAPQDVAVVAAVADAASAAAPDVAPLLPAPEAAVASAPEPAPSIPAASAAAATAAPAFEWPRSTRLTYHLTGYYRGDVDGRASVEWLREGDRYQVHLDVSVGPSFAPLLSRRMSSAGDIGPDGLRPRRYEEETRVALRSPRGNAVSFDGPLLRLANGTELPSPPGVQDTASQFVQLTWLFTTQPQRLRPGQSVDVMLALPRRVDLWVYDVLDSETLHTPAGAIDAVHVRPRRPARPTGELTAEMWIAPTLQYLPVRIVIRQDTDTFVDLLIDRLPQQAADAPR